MKISHKPSRSKVIVSLVLMMALVTSMLQLTPLGSSSNGLMQSISPTESSSSILSQTGRTQTGSAGTGFQGTMTGTISPTVTGVQVTLNGLVSQATFTPNCATSLPSCGVPVFMTPVLIAQNGSIYTVAMIDSSGTAPILRYLNTTVTVSGLFRQYDSSAMSTLTCTPFPCNRIVGGVSVTSIGPFPGVQTASGSIPSTEGSSTATTTTPGSNYPIPGFDPLAIIVGIALGAGLLFLVRKRTSSRNQL